jgi:transposase
MPKIYSYNFKISVINFYNSDLFTIENCLNIFNISKTCLYNWVKLYNNNLLPIRSNIRNNYESKINTEIQKYIILYVTKRTIFKVKNLIFAIDRIFNLTVSKSSIYRVLSERNITYKQISQKIIPKKANNKKLIKELIKNIKTVDANNVVSIDETSFDTHMKSNFGWCKKGKSITKIIKVPKRKRLTLTLAITKNKVIGYNFISGASNKTNFEQFLKTNVLPFVNNGAILMDNVCFHHCKIIKECINATTNKIIYNVPYNPKTNPVEFTFSVIKKDVKNKNYKLVSNINELKKYILTSLKLITKDKLTNMFNHSLGI